MQYAALVESFQASYNLNENVPDLFLFDVCLTLLIIADLLKDVAIISILHHKTKTWSRLVNKCVSICYHIRMVNWSQNAHFIECIFFLFLWKWKHLNVFQGVYVVVILSPNLEYRTVSAIAQLLDDSEVWDARTLPQTLVIGVGRLIHLNFIIFCLGFIVTFIVKTTSKKILFLSKYIS